jgi:hypothetical protein
LERAVHLAQRTWQRRVWDRRPWLFASHNILNAYSAHLMPYFANAVEAEVFLKDTLNLRLQICFKLGAI